MTAASSFPDPVYQRTVLAPAFEGVRIHFADSMHRIDRAHLVMLRETGILTEDQAGMIAQALMDIRAQTAIDQLEYTGEYEDYFFLVEAELARRLGELGGLLHTARSRNDIDHTAFRLVLRCRADRLLAEILSLAAAVLVKAQDESETVIIAYTHGQPAQPTTFGHYLGAVIEVVLRDATRLDHAIENVDQCPMGAAAITTSSFPINRQRVSELLGFRAPVLNSYGGIASVDYITGLYSAVKLVILHLGRVIQDLIQWSSFEVGQLMVPDGLVQVSSIMPQKRNPVAIEHLRHMASISMGYCDMVVGTMHNTPFTDMNDSEAEVQQEGFLGIDHARRTLALLARVVCGCGINAGRVKSIGEASCITITELADTLVREEELGFRTAHEIASSTARAVIERQSGLAKGYGDFIKAFWSVTGRDTRISQAAFKSAVALETFILRRDRHGGPAPAALSCGLEFYSQQLEALQSNVKARKSRQSAAARALDDTFTSLFKI